MSIGWKGLAAPFTADEVEWRIARSGSKNGKPWASVLVYVTARAIMDRLDQVVGPDQWWDEYRMEEHGILCGISIRTPEGVVTKWDGSPETQVESFKGGLSKAFVRCAVKWSIGRYLYNFPDSFATFVDRGVKGASYVKIDGQPYHWTPPDYDAIMARLDPGAQRVAATFEATPVDPELAGLQERFRSAWALDKDSLTTIIADRGHDHPKAVKDDPVELSEILTIFDALLEE